MFKRVSFLIAGIFLIAWTAFHFDSLFAYKSMLTNISISDMSQDQQKNTGLDKLTDKEKMALQEWISQNYAQKPGSSKSANPSISEVLGNGQYVKLTDGTIWKINPSDTPITQGWITPVDIIVTKSGDPNYPYTLTNSLTGSAVRAQSVKEIPDYLKKTPQPPAQPQTPTLKTPATPPATAPKQK